MADLLDSHVRETLAENRPRPSKPLTKRWRCFAPTSNRPPTRIPYPIDRKDHPMKSRAAVAFKAGEPLQIVEIDVAPPKKGEVLIKITDNRRMPHRRLHPER